MDPITTITTLMLVLTSPSMEVTSVPLPVVIASHEACMTDYLSADPPVVDEGWSANYSCLTESGVFAELRDETDLVEVKE